MVNQNFCSTALASYKGGGKRVLKCNKWLSFILHTYDGSEFFKLPKRKKTIYPSPNPPPRAFANFSYDPYGYRSLAQDCLSEKEQKKAIILLQRVASCHFVPLHLTAPANSAGHWFLGILQPKFRLNPKLPFIALGWGNFGPFLIMISALFEEKSFLDGCEK